MIAFKQELMKFLGPIFIGVLTTILTTKVIEYFKDKKIRKLEYIVNFDIRQKVINKIIFDSLYSFLVIRMIKYLDGGITKVMSIVFYIMIYILSGTITFKIYKEGIMEIYKDSTDYKSLLIYSSIQIPIAWIGAGASIYKIEYLGDKATAFTLIFMFGIYSVLVGLSVYFKAERSRNYEVILIKTNQGDEYKALRVDYCDTYITFLSKSGDKRMIIFNDKIDSIEYIYSNKTVLDYLNS